MQKDSLGDRMKDQYESRTQIYLPRRTYTILRVDGKAFHTFTSNCDKPWDHNLSRAMDMAALQLCIEAQGATFGYVQSDEISVLLSDLESRDTQAWFDGNLQKLVSVGASIVTEAFAEFFYRGGPRFDCRAFTIPDPVEVENYFIWRQQDAIRNSIQSLAQAHFSHKELQGLNVAQLQEKLMNEKGINWSKESNDFKNGRAVSREGGQWVVDHAVPVFTQMRNYLTINIPKHGYTAV